MKYRLPACLRMHLFALVFSAYQLGATGKQGFSNQDGAQEQIARFIEVPHEAAPTSFFTTGSSDLLIQERETPYYFSIKKPNTYTDVHIQDTNRLPYTDRPATVRACYQVGVALFTLAWLYLLSDLIWSAVKSKRFVLGYVLIQTIILFFWSYNATTFYVLFNGADLERFFIKRGPIYFSFCCTIFWIIVEIWFFFEYLMTFVGGILVLSLSQNENNVEGPTLNKSERARLGSGMICLGAAGSILFFLAIKVNYFKLRFEALLKQYQELLTLQYRSIGRFPTLATEKIKV